MIVEWASIYIMYDASIKLFERAWAWHVVPVSKHLMDTESGFAPWDLSKAHILVSSPVFLGSIAKGLLSMGKQSIRKTCRCRATRCYKKPELLGWDPPPPLNKHNRFQHTVSSHIKSCTAHWGWEGGPRQKARLFVTEGIWRREPRFNKQGLHWTAYLSLLHLSFIQQ